MPFLCSDPISNTNMRTIHLSTIYFTIVYFKWIHFSLMCLHILYQHEEKLTTVSPLLRLEKNSYWFRSCRIFGCNVHIVVTSRELKIPYKQKHSHHQRRRKMVLKKKNIINSLVWIASVQYPFCSAFFF